MAMTTATEIMIATTTMLAMTAMDTVTTDPGPTPMTLDMATATMIESTYHRLSHPTMTTMEARLLLTRMILVACPFLGRILLITVHLLSTNDRMIMILVEYHFPLGTTKDTIVTTVATTTEVVRLVMDIRTKNPIFDGLERD